MEEEIFWHTKSGTETMELLKSAPDGISEKEAQKRLEHFGPNAIRTAKPESWLRHFLRQFESPLVYILLIAALIVVYTGELLDGAIIILVLLINAIVGAVQEGRAAATLQALQNFVTTTATVLRSNAEQQTSDQTLVIGDVIILREGEKVPADCRILEQAGLMVNEAGITGESMPVEKITDSLQGPDITVPERKNLLFKGTLITRGWAKAVVYATGTQTLIGEISEKVAETKHEIPLQTHLRELANLLIIIVLVFSIGLFFVGIAQGLSSQDMFSTVVALAVSVIPEGLPIAVTLILAGGVHRMSQRRALVKKLQAVEALSHVDIVAVDKTGTITKNELTAVSLTVGTNLYSLTGSGYEPEGSVKSGNQVIIAQEEPGLLLAGKVFALSSNAKLYQGTDGTWHVTGDPIEAALIVAGGKLGIKRDEILGKYQLVEELSFDYKRKFHATVHKAGGKHFLSAVGAPEAILALCPGVRKTAVMTKVKTFASKGLRVLAYAYADNAKLLRGEESPKLSFGGLVCLEDQMQENVAEAVQSLNQAGIRVVMLTGDNPITARSIAERAGIAQTSAPVITGQDLAEQKLSAKDLNRVEVFARVTPEDKLTIIQAFGNQHKTIAMTGDGVNDAPALVAADLGLAMGKNGTEVAKEAADIVLLDDNFSNIIAAVEEGRNMYLTIKKVLMYLFSTSIAELLVITIAILLGLPLPLVAVQIIWLNLVTDGFLTVALSMEPKDKNLLSETFTKPTRYILDYKSVVRMLIVGSAMALVTLWIFSGVQGSLILKQTAALTTLAVVQWLNAFNARTERSIFNTNPLSNYWLWFALVIVILLQLFAVYLPGFQTVLKTVPLSWDVWQKIILASSAVLLVDELWKSLFRAFEGARLGYKKK